MNNKTLLLVAFFSVIFAGCSSGTTPTPDPFFGRMTISPPSTLSGSTSSYTPPAVLAAPVSPPQQAWQSPPSPNFAQTAPVSPRYGSPSSTQPLTSQPTRPIYLNQSAIEESVRQPSYTPGSTSSYGNGTIAAAGSNRAANLSRTTTPLKIYPDPGISAINGKPVREKSDISYRSADGSIPQYADPRSSFGQAPNARFKQTGRGTEAPLWSPSSSQTNTPSTSGGTSSLFNTNSGPERISPMNLNTTQTRTASPTLASGNAPKKMLPPIRGYASPQVAQNGTTAGSTSTWSRAGRSTQRATTTLSPAIRRPTSIPTIASARPGEPRILPAPPEGINIADLPDATHIATRPSDSGSASGTRRLNFETPVTGRSSGSSSVRHDPKVKPVSFTPTIRYSHNENYTQLRGELDYSNIDERWKLRYISINDETSDEYGGSVILSQTSKLSGFERGDFIEVRGRVLSGPQGDWGYARGYEVQEIRRIR